MTLLVINIALGIIIFGILTLYYYKNYYITHNIISIPLNNSVTSFSFNNW